MEDHWLDTGTSAAHAINRCPRVLVTMDNTDPSYQGQLGGPRYKKLESLELLDERGDNIV